MGKLFNTYKNYISSLLLFAMLLQVANNGVFLHSHTQSDGTIITHAHPFQKSNTASSNRSTHDHTKSEYLILQQIQLLFTLPGIIIVFLQAFRKTFLIPYTKKVVPDSAFYNFSSRAPPFFCF